MMKKVLVVFGTRPDAIKMCPVVIELQSRADIETIVCVTGQHKEMLAQVLDAFSITPNYDFSIMRASQTLFSVTSSILDKMQLVLERENPDMVLVHGDTTTAFATTLACFYLQIPVGHVEAGLRTYNLNSPFPEEFNRQVVALIAKLHFAPTQSACDNLTAEGKDPKRIFVTGNTSIDALKYTVNKAYSHPIFEWLGSSRFILITAHRRENLGEPLRNMFRAIKRVMEEHPDLKAVYPIHLNPQVREAADEIFVSQDRIRVIEPLDVIGFHHFMAKAFLILTDSGGIQEEAPSLGKPVLVMRDTTERPEGIEAGTLKLVGTEEASIYASFSQLIDDPTEYQRMAQAHNPYGDGYASRKIADITIAYLNNNEETE